MDLDKYAEQLQGGRFATLSPFFKGLRTSDLDSAITESDLLAYVPVPHHLVLKVFLSTFRKETTDPFLVPSTSSSINLSQKVCSTTFQQWFPDKITVDRLEGFLVDRQCDKLDLSQNNLLDEDLRAIANLTEKIRLKELDLRYNRFYGESEPLKSIVTNHMRTILRNVEEWVIITGNALASVDRKDFFSGLSKKELEKLIWIPQIWLAPGNWKVVVENAEDQELVKAQHELFYSSGRE